MNRKRTGTRLWLPVAFLMLLSSFVSDARARNPSVLIHCARSSVSQWQGWVDLDYLRELHQRGFEVDYTDRHEDFTWERVRQYDLLVFSSVPLESGSYHDNTPDTPPYRDSFIEIVERFLESGGGVMLMARSLNADESFLPLIERWGARIPFELIEEDERANVAPMPRMSGAEKLWFTDNVTASPVTEGVHQVWLPLTPHYFAAETMPIEVSSDWTVVLSGRASSRTSPNESKEARIHRPPDARSRPGGVRSPDLFAIRNYKRGRLAFCSIWPQYSIGQGTRWLYERRVLTAGLGSRRSDFGRLLENTFAWLAEPGLSASPDVGFTTDEIRLIPPNERPGIKESFIQRSLNVTANGSAAIERARKAPIRRGLIGASIGDGKGTASVEAYARAARETGIDFVVFLEEYERLDPAKLQRLRSDCREFSDDTLQLIPGYRLETNTGNRIFLFGPEIDLLPTDLVTSGRLNLQHLDPDSGKPVIGVGFQTWFQRNAIHQRRINVGFLDLDGHGRSLPLSDLRLCSMVALRLFRNGKPLEDHLEAYLQASAGTLPPAPVAVHRVDSPQELRRAALSRTGLTYATADSPASLWKALSYATQYDAPNLFTTDGPVIEAWPRVAQYYTLGGEEFVARAARLACPIAVRSEIGLREIRIYDGGRLFRRFLLDGAKRFEQVLELSASVMKTLVLVAEDEAGGRAVSNALRSWKGADMAPMFCGDRINHCSREPIMAKGPGYVQVSLTPTIDSGYTWDGGPRGEARILHLVDAGRPVLRSNKGVEGRDGFQNRAVLVFADEGAVRVTAQLENLYDDEVPVINPWVTWGPLLGPTRLFRSSVSFTAFDRPTIGPSPEAYPGFPVKVGAEVSLFENRVTFLRKQRVDSLLLFRQRPYRGPLPVSLIHGRGLEPLAIYELPRQRSSAAGLVLQPGDWIGVFGPQPTNSSFHFNRGAPIRLEFKGDSGLRLEFLADLEGQSFTRDETVDVELMSVVDPVDAPVRDAERMLQIARYLIAPPGLEILRGTRVRTGLAEGQGLIEIEAEAGAAALRLPRPETPRGVPLPVRVDGLNPRWSAGVLLREGYVLGFYGPPEDRYREAGLDFEGRACVSLFPDRAARTEIEIGHPVVCDSHELFVQVTRLDDNPPPGTWRVAVNNPTDREIVTTCRANLQAPGLELGETTVTLAPGGYAVLVE